MIAKNVKDVNEALLGVKDGMTIMLGGLDFVGFLRMQ